jgi:hypothetical protein
MSARFRHQPFTSPQKPSSTTVGDAFPDRRDPSDISSNRAIAEHAAGEVTWFDEEQERVRMWAQSEPRAAAEWASTLPAAANRRFALEAIALAWGPAIPLRQPGGRRAFPMKPTARTR